MITKARKYNPYLHFLGRLAIFLLTLFVLDRITGLILRNYYFKQHSGTMYRTTYSMETAKPDMMIFGSSRATHHYKPNVLNRELGMSCYNAGKDGHQILYHYAVLESVLKRYIPKVIVLDISVRDLVKSEENYDWLSSLLPYYKTHPEIRRVVNLKSNFEKFKALSAAYPFNSDILRIVKGYSNISEEKEEEGYLPLEKELHSPLASDYHLKPDEIDGVKLHYFEKFLEACKNSGAKLYVLFSPIYIRYEEPPIGLTTAQEICRRYNIPFYDYSRDEEFLANPSLFQDRSHLNDKGATAYTERIAKEIKKDL